MSDFAVLLRDFDMFEAMGVMFFDERDNLIGAKIQGLFGEGVDESNGGIDFIFSDEDRDARFEVDGKMFGR